MNGVPEFTVRRVRWSEAGSQLRAVRTAVFVEEQNVPVELEWDDLGVQCLHVIAESATGQAIGTGRLLPGGHIGRALLLELLAAAGEGGFESAELNAQSRAVGFYARFGFGVVSGEFLDAGIPHRTMRVDLIKRT